MSDVLLHPAAGRTLAPTPSQARATRLLDVLWAGSILVWGWQAFSSRSHGLILIPLAVLLLHVLIAWLLLRRTRVRGAVSWIHVCAVTPSICSALGALLLAPPPHQWPVAVQGTFLLGTALAFAAFAYLGASFAVLPASRDVVMRGPYGLVRHPAYVGQGLMVLSVCAAVGGLAGLALGLGSIAALVLRIRVEESVLRRAARYRAYQRCVPWRLLPRLW